jgi:hypothetical protein
LSLCSALQPRAGLLWLLLTSPTASSQPLGHASFIAPPETSPGIAHQLPCLCPPHILPQTPCKNWALNLFAFSPSAAASYVVPVRRASILPTASFRFCLTTDTLAVQLALPLAGCALDFDQLIGAPCRAHKKRDRIFIRSLCDLKTCWFTAVTDRTFDQGQESPSEDCSGSLQLCMGHSQRSLKSVMYQVRSRIDSKHRKPFARSGCSRCRSSHIW